MFRDTTTCKPESADERTRESGVLKRNGTAFPLTFLCLANSPSFCRKQPESPKQSAVESINKEIECDSFVKWIPAKSAQEHEDMTILEKVREENRRAQEQMRAEQLAVKKEADERYAEERRHKAEDRERARRAEERAEKSELRADELAKSVRLQRWGIALSVVISAALAIKAVVEWIGSAATQS
jgi:hypothetical protein